MWEIKVRRDPNAGWLDNLIGGGSWQWSARAPHHYPLGNYGHGYARTKKAAIRNADRWVAAVESSYLVRTKAAS